MSTTSNPPPIIIPGPELKHRIDKAALRMAEKPQLREKVLASAQRDEFSFLLYTNEFHGYFLHKWHDAKQELQRTGGAKPADKGAAAAPTVPSAPPPPTVQSIMQSILRSSQMLREDPLPDRFSVPSTIPAKGSGSVHLSGPTGGSLPQLDVDVMLLAARYAARHGDAFVERVLHGQGRSRQVDFLMDDHPRHHMFVALRRAYELVLAFPPEVEEPLVRDAEADDVKTVLDVCQRRTNYFRAKRARQQAEITTTDQVSQRLNWREFSVVGNFSLEQLGFSHAVGAAPSVTSGGDTTKGRPPVPEAPRIVSDAPLVRSGVSGGTVLLDRDTGVRLHAEDAAAHMKASAALMAGAPATATSNTASARRGTALADDDEVAANTSVMFSGKR